MKRQPMVDLDVPLAKRAVDATEVEVADLTARPIASTRHLLELVAPEPRVTLPDQMLRHQQRALERTTLRSLDLLDQRTVHGARHQGATDRPCDCLHAVWLRKEVEQHHAIQLVALGLLAGVLRMLRRDVERLALNAVRRSERLIPVFGAVEGRLSQQGRELLHRRFVCSIPRQAFSLIKAQARMISSRVQSTAMTQP